MGSLVRVGEVLRYKSDKNPDPQYIDEFRNFFNLTQAPGMVRVQIERGIDVPADVRAPGGNRRPAILIRSSPWKAGSDQTPWHDVFDLNGGHIRYFGDHKVNTPEKVGETSGNKALLQAFSAHQAPTPQQRMDAVPLMVFRSVRRNGRNKGYVEFCGLGIVERAERVVQWAQSGSTTFVNYVFDIALLDLSAEGDQIDWRWVNDRRNAALAVEKTLDRAPESWRRWIAEGAAALPRLRRRVARAFLQQPKDQRPRAGSSEQKDLERIYRRFDKRKVEFENLAAAIAARVIRNRGADYHQGWLTRPTQDGGTDFVGRLDVGTGSAVTKIVVLGQAKCVKPGTNISAEQVARVVARLQRGWIGVYVTTGAFSTSAQTEIAEDRYPIILIHGLMLAEQLRRLSNESHAGDLDACMEELISRSSAEVVHRRPEEILLT